MHRFLKDRSEVSIAYDVRRLEHVVEAVQIGAADVGLVLGLDRHPAVNVEVLSRTHMVAVLPNVKGLAEAAVTAKALSDSDFIGLENSSRLGQKVRAAFDRDGASYRPRVEVRYCSTATVLVSVGIGAAVVDPYTATFQSNRDIVQRPFLPPTEIQTVMLTRKGIPRSRLLHEFIAEIKKALSEFDVRRQQYPKTAERKPPARRVTNKKTKPKKKP